MSGLAAVSALFIRKDRPITGALRLSNNILYTFVKFSHPKGPPDYWGIETWQPAILVIKILDGSERTARLLGH